MSEKHTIRNRIIIGVSTGIILTILTSAWLTGMLIMFLHWLWSAIKFMGNLLVHRVAIPVWIIALFGILAIFPILHLVRLLGRKENDLSEDTYTEDNLFGVVWRWRYNSSGINNLWAFCPHCDLELVYSEKRSEYCAPISIHLSLRNSYVKTAI